MNIFWASSQSSGSGITGDTTTTTTAAQVTTTSTSTTSTSTTTAAPVTSQVHKLSLGEVNSTFEGVASTWQNVGIDYDTTPLVLLDEDGVDQGLTLKIPESTISINVSKKTLHTSITSGDANFPDAVLIKGYNSYGKFVTDNENGTIRISGLTSGVEYTFEIFSSVDVAVTGWAVSDSDYTGFILSGGTANDTDNLNPIDNTGTTITLTNTPNELGFIDLCFRGNEDWNHPVMNAVIITKGSA